MTSPSVGFIGTGIMGASMAGHLLAAGHPLHVYNRTRARAQPLCERGAIWHATPASLAAAVDVVITMVGYPTDVEAVYFGNGQGGVLEAARPGALLIDMTTSSPTLARRIADAALARGQDALDAPVSGGDVGAREARLSIMVGGSTEAFARARPLFERLGKTIVHQGPAGSGQHTKLCNQIAIASTMMAACEALTYARAAGLDPARVLDSIGSGAAGSWTLANLAPRRLRDDWAPGFIVRHFLKDMGIALASARELGIELPGLTLAESLYQKLAAAGHADAGTQALARLYFGRL